MAGIFAGMWEKRDLTVVPEAWRKNTIWGETQAGVNVTHDKALEYSAVFGCIRNLSQDLAKMPLKVYKKRPGGGQDETRDHPLWELLHNTPNEDITSYTFRETLQGHLGGWGNAFSQVRFNPNNGQVMDLWPLRPDYMDITRDPITRKLVYYYHPPGKQARYFPASEILHIPGFGYDGVQGYDPIRYARNTIGLGMGAQEYGARFYANDARPGFVLKTPNKLSEEALKNLRESLENSNLINAHKPRILEEGLEIQTIGIHPDAAQFLDTRRFQSVEICRWYRMPPHKIQELERATFSNIEHQGIEYVVDTLLPWVVNWEQAITKTLFTPAERKAGYYAAFVVEGLMRGDVITRGNYYALARQWGWYSADDIRDKEGDNPLPDGIGKVYLTPLNMIPAGSSPVPNMARGIRDIAQAETRADGWEPAGRRVAQIRRNLTRAQIPIFEDIAARILRREKNDITSKAKKMIPNRPLNEFDDWLAGFYDDHAEFTAAQFTPALLGFGDLIAGAVAEEGFKLENESQLENFVHAYARGLGIRLTGEHLFILREKIENALKTDPEYLLEIIESTLDGWAESQPAIIAHDEAARSGNAMAFSIYGQAGVIYLRSVAFGESCPYCTDLDGRVIGIQQYFLHAGQDYQPAGAERPLTVNKNKKHAPYHGGCDCMVIAG